MKTKYFLSGMIVLLLLSNISGKKTTKVPDNQIYINGLDQGPTVILLVAAGTPSVTPITIGSVNPVSTNVVANINAAPGLLPAYNKLNNSKYPILPDDSYVLSGGQVTISSGSNVSNAISLTMTSLANIKRGMIYLLPVTISNATGGLPVLKALQTVYYLVGIGTSETVASVNKNYFTANLFSGPVFSNMKAVTYQVRLYGFAYVGPAGIMGSDHASPPGMELRLGDFADANNAFAVGVGSAQGSILPAKLNTQVWYNIAVVADNGTYKIYLNGVLVKSGTYTGTIDLTQKSITMGFCYNDDYNLNAWINECRIWSRALTQDEIQQNSCEVDPKSPGLEAYWKFNEGAGNIAHDATGHGYDATAENDVVWVTGQICQ